RCPRKKAVITTRAKRVRRSQRRGWGITRAPSGSAYVVQSRREPYAQPSIRVNSESSRPVPVRLVVVGVGMGVFDQLTPARVTEVTVRTVGVGSSRSRSPTGTLMTVKAKAVVLDHRDGV